MDNDYKNIEKILQNIKDIERHNRKIYLLNINPKDLYLWYNYILSIH
jgi:DNA mismatch repair ATPase MutS